MVNVPTWESILLLVLRFQCAEQAAGCAQVSINKNKKKNERRRTTEKNNIESCTDITHVHTLHTTF